MEQAATYAHAFLGMQFHSTFPNQVRTECDESCGGCGIYPNMLNGRAGVQLVTSKGDDVCYLWLIYKMLYFIKFLNIRNICAI